MLRKICIGIAVVMGVGAVGNGAYMLYDPANWYFAVPGVTTTGPFNQHFIRDIGLIFLMVGTAYLTGAVKPMFRTVLWAAPSLWLSGHALFHFWEVAVGICSPSAMVRDFPAVTLPAALGILITLWAISDDRAAASSSAS